MFPVRPASCPGSIVRLRPCRFSLDREQSHLHR